MILVPILFEKIHKMRIVFAWDILKKLIFLLDMG